MTDVPDEAPAEEPTNVTLEVQDVTTDQDPKDVE